MREAEVAVTFEPAGRTVYVLPGTKLLEAAVLAGTVLETPCGGEGRCGKCRVLVTRGAGQPNAAELQGLAADELRAGWRLACQSEVEQASAVRIPESSLARSHHQILVESHGSVPADGEPLVRKQYVELPSPCRGDDAGDLLRLERALGPFDAELAVVRLIPDRLRQSGFRGTGVLADGRLMDFEPGDTRAENYAVAVDVGTTTLVAALVDAQTGCDLAIAARLNPQTRFGDDVLSRIVYARDRATGLDELQGVLASAIGEMIGELCREAGVRRERIYAVTLSGNNAMLHLACGIDPRSLGEVPFVGGLGGGLRLPAGELGLAIHPRGRAYVFPVIGGFVGGDTVAGILATGLADSEEPALLVDIGTNGEIVLCAGGKLMAASTAAGPAFEGARISQGMRAARGAIEKIVMDGHLRYQVIGDVPPIGLCGSALIDAAAEMLRHGILSSTGRLHAPDELPQSVPRDLVERITLHNQQVAFVLAPGTETAGGEPILLTQRDLRELQLATGAIRAGIGILLRRAGLTVDDLERVLVAGGFGNFIRRSNAQRIGLLPHGIPHSRIQYQGNTSLAGARWVAVSREARTLAEQLARRTEHVDLSTDPGFHAAFADAMIFPESF